MSTPVAEQVDRLAAAFPRCKSPYAWREELLRAVDARESIAIVRQAVDGLIDTWKSHERPAVARVLQEIAQTRRAVGKPAAPANCNICYDRKYVGEVEHFEGRDGLPYELTRTCPRCIPPDVIPPWATRRITAREYEDAMAQMREASRTSMQEERARRRDGYRRDVLTLTRRFALQLRERGVQSIDALVEHVDELLRDDDAAREATNQTLSNYLNEPDATDGSPAGRKRTVQTTARTLLPTRCANASEGVSTKPAPAGGDRAPRPVSDLFPHRTA